MTDASKQIHPAAAEFTEAQIAADPILHFFHYAHLPPALQAASSPFAVLALHMVNTLPRNAERSAGLRKLLEAKDCAVRANIGPKPVSTPEKPERKLPTHISRYEDPRIRGEYMYIDDETKEKITDPEILAFAKLQFRERPR